MRLDLNDEVIKWYVSLCFLYAFEYNTPKDRDVIKNIIKLESIINEKINVYNAMKTKCIR